MSSVVPNTTLKQRLEAKTVPTVGGCAEYTGYICESTGYGKISNRPGPPIGAHIAAYITNGGAIGPSQVVRHKCDNRRCVNPSHLEVGTQQDNVDDMWERNRADVYKKRVKYCPQGHSYDSADHEGYRSCSICRNLRARRRSAERRTREGRTSLDLYCHSCWCRNERCRCEEISALSHPEPRYEYKEN